MTVAQLAEALNMEVLAMPEPEREICGAYAGDLLSWVMGRAKENCVWATIMTNKNVLAVATLVDVAATVICEGSEIDNDVITTAAGKDANLLRTQLPIYEFCVRLSEVLK